MDGPVGFELWMGGRLGITVYTFIRLDGWLMNTEWVRSSQNKTSRMILPHSLSSGLVNAIIMQATTNTMPPQQLSAHKRPDMMMLNKRKTSSKINATDTYNVFFSTRYYYIANL